MYTHPWEIDPGQPRQDVDLRTRINHYFNLGRTEARLRGLLERFPFAAMGDVLARLEDADALPDYALEREAA